MVQLDYYKLKKRAIDYYGLKQDAYGYWQDQIYLRDQGDSRVRTIDITASESLYRCLENLTSCRSTDFDQDFLDELDELSYQHPRIAAKAKRIARDLLEAYWEREEE